MLVGSEGCSHYFLLGKLHVGDPEALTKEMDELRTSLLADPYFKGIASMQPAARKTALKFHAKDDVPEVRREVYELLLAQAEKIRFYGVVCATSVNWHRTKAQKRDADPKYRYRPNDLYDGLVRMLFGSRFHQADRFENCFASRGSSDRTKALKTAIAHAAGDYERDFGSASKAEVDVTSRAPTGCGGLQAVDYLLWALQRFYEFEQTAKAESECRYVELVWPLVSEIHDLDRLEGKKRGVSYVEKRPLTREGPDERKKEARDIGCSGRGLIISRHGAEFHPPASLVYRLDRKSPLVSA